MCSQVLRIYVSIFLVSFIGNIDLSQAKNLEFGTVPSTTDSLKQSSAKDDTPVTVTTETIIKPLLPIRQFTKFSAISRMNLRGRVWGYKLGEKSKLAEFNPLDTIPMVITDLDSIRFEYITDSTENTYKVIPDVFHIERNKPFRINIVRDAIAGKRATLKEMNGKELLRLEIDDEDYQKLEQFDFKLSGKDDKYFSTKRSGFSIIVTFKKLNPEKFDELVEELENRSGKNRKILKFEVIVIDTIAKHEDKTNHEESMTFKLRFEDYD